MKLFETAEVGDCQQCGSSGIPVLMSHAPIRHRSTEDEAFCEPCFSMTRLDDPMTINLAVCTNLILKAIQELRK